MAEWLYPFSSDGGVLAKKLTNLIHIGELARELEPDSVSVLLHLAERLTKGQKEYGPLRLATDTRDFHQDLYEEMLDASVYCVMRILKERK